MTESICFHHNDLDGIFAGACVKLQFPDTKMVSVKYGDDWKKEDVEGKLVFVVDFSFENMNELAAACAMLVWCDHHGTVMRAQAKAWNDPEIKGLRSTEYAGCVLTYAYLQGIPLDEISEACDSATIPGAIQSIGAYDLWKFEEGSPVDDFSAGAFVDITSSEDPMFPDLFGLNGVVDEVDAFNKILADGVVLNAAAKNRIVFATKDAETKFVKPNGQIITIMAVNATTDISRLGSYINTELDVDIAVIYQILPDAEEIKVSLRSRKYDVSRVAVNLGGGGHPGAAGFITDDTPKEMVDTLCCVIYRIGSTLGR